MNRELDSHHNCLSSEVRSARTESQLVGVLLSFKGHPSKQKPLINSFKCPHIYSRSSAQCLQGLGILENSQILEPPWAEHNVIKLSQGAQMCSGFNNGL